MINLNQTQVKQCKLTPTITLLPMTSMAGKIPL